MFQAKGVGGKVKVSTVDAFQGAEREVIVYSCTRTQALGFLDSPNRSGTDPLCPL